MANRNNPKGGVSEEPPAPAPEYTLDRDGKIDGVIHRPHDDRRAWTQGESARLELAAQVKREIPVPERPVREAMPASRKWAILAAIALGAILLPVAGRWAYLAMTHEGPGKAHGLLVIDSHPDNAHVFINGEDVGRTPYVVPNKYTPGTTVPVRVTYPGAEDWNGEFPGGVATTVTAELQAK